MATVEGGLAGAFTAKGARETIYLVTLTPCAAGAVAHRVTVVGGDKVVANADVAESALYEVRDLDGDGANEILVVGTRWLKDGTVITTARLLSAEDGQIVPLYDFGPLSSSRCIGAPEDKAESAILTYRTTATGMEFHAEKRARGCRK